MEAEKKTKDEKTLAAAEEKQPEKSAVGKEEKGPEKSETPEKKGSEKKDSEKKESEKPEAEKKEEELTVLKARIAELETQVGELKNAYAKAYADTENTRKRLDKEFAQHMKYHIQDFALEILPVIDNCERALAVKPKDTEDENYRHAFEMVFKQMMKTLEKEGVEVIACEGKEFDPNWMQAVMSEEKEGVKPNHVIAVLQKGYKLKDRLLRAAMVKVSA